MSIDRLRLRFITLPREHAIEIAAELARRGFDPSDRVTITIEPDELIN